MIEILFLIGGLAVLVGVLIIGVRVWLGMLQESRKIRNWPGDHEEWKIGEKK